MGRFKYTQEKILTAAVSVDYVSLDNIDEADMIDALVAEGRFDEAAYHAHYHYAMDVAIGMSTETLRVTNAQIVTCAYERAAHEAYFSGNRAFREKYGKTAEKKLDVLDYDALRVRAAFLIGEQIIENKIEQAVPTSLSDDGYNYGYQFLVNKDQFVGSQRILNEKEKWKTLSDEMVTLTRLKDDTITYICGPKAIVVKAAL